MIRKPLKSSQRSKRIAEVFRTELATMLMKEIKDPRVQGLVTIMHVDIGKDLRLARVYVAIYGNDDQKRTAMTGLNRAKGFIKTSMSKRMDLRRFPEIEFHLDETIDAEEKITRLLAQAQTSNGYTGDF